MSGLPIVIDIEVVEEKPGVFLWYKNGELAPGQYELNCIIPDDKKFDPIRPFLSRLNGPSFHINKYGLYRVGSGVEFRVKDRKNDSVQSG